MSRGRSTTAAFVLEIQGANVVTEYLLGAAGIMDSFFPQILDVSADIGIDHARKLVQVDTGATRDSINSSPGVWAKPERGEWSIRFGPTTFYAPFLEYGTVKNAPFPFMHPAGDLAGNGFVRATEAFVNMLVSGRIFSGGGAAGEALSDPRVSSSITGMRSFLYTTSKALGDISVFTGGRDFFGPIRGTMLGLAKGLGDVSSIMTRTVGGRITNRLTGRVTGRIIGFGSASFSGGNTYSAFVGGSAGHRIYQRAAGRYTKGAFGSFP